LGEVRPSFPSLPKDSYELTIASVSRMNFSVMALLIFPKPLELLRFDNLLPGLKFDSLDIPVPTGLNSSLARLAMLLSAF
jgi:hypothetical protein